MSNVPPPPSAPQYAAAQPAPQNPATAPRRAGVWIAVAAVVALVVGVGVGVAAAQPSKNSVADQRNAAQSQVRDLQASLTSAQSSASTSSGARDKCSKAAADAKDLIAQHENLWADFSTYMSSPSGSGAEAEIVLHMDSQQQTMITQRDVVNEELAACRAAVG